MLTRLSPVRYPNTRLYGYKADYVCTCIAHDFPAAARLYSEAIKKNPQEPTLWCNRAYARMKLEEFGYALSDASKYLAPMITLGRRYISHDVSGQAIALDPKYAKAYYR